MSVSIAAVRFFWRRAGFLASPPSFAAFTGRPALHHERDGLPWPGRHLRRVHPPVRCGAVLGSRRHRARLGCEQPHLRGRAWLRSLGARAVRRGHGPHLLRVWHVLCDRRRDCSEQGACACVRLSIPEPRSSPVVWPGSMVAGAWVAHVHRVDPLPPRYPPRALHAPRRAVRWAQRPVVPPAPHHPGAAPCVCCDAKASCPSRSFVRMPASPSPPCNYAPTPPPLQSAGAVLLVIAFGIGIASVLSPRHFATAHGALGLAVVICVFLQASARARAPVAALCAWLDSSPPLADRVGRAAPPQGGAGREPDHCEEAPRRD